MTTVAMIPARYESSRFPGKLLKMLGGKPIIVQTYEAALATMLFDEVYVVTDHELIQDAIEKIGGKVIISKRKHQCGTDRIAEVVGDIAVDIVVNIQGDEPFIKREPLEKLLRVFKEEEVQQVDVASLMREISDWDDIANPDFVKVVTDSNNFALYFSRSPIPYPRNNKKEVRYFGHIGVYAFRKQAILDFSKLPIRPLEAVEELENLRCLECGMKMKMVETDFKGIGIDTPEGLKKAAKYLASLTEV